MATSVLGPEELKTYQSLALPKRKSEYLAGRICAKDAFNNFAAIDQISLTEILILNSEGGRPFIDIPLALQSKVSPFDISVSHSSGYACAVVANHQCGIDIQRKKNTLIKVKERFCYDDEEKVLAGSCKGESLSQLTMLWAAKEAIRKACSRQFLPGFLELRLKRIDIAGSGCLLMFSCLSDYLKVYGELYGDYALALCLTEEANNARTSRS